MRLKRFIPNSLYGRFLLIIVVPVLIVQVVSIYVFYYTHIDVVSKHMARSVVSEMDFIKKSVSNPEYQNLVQNFSQDIGIDFSFEERRRLPKKAKIGDSSWVRSKIYNYINIFPLIDPYNRFKLELKEHQLTPYEIFQDQENDDLIIVKVQTRQGLISFDVPVKRIASSSNYVFTIWMILTAFITSIISIMFLKNQIKSVKELNGAAEKFGRGQDVPDFRPSGPSEIRSLGISFIRMKERVMRQILQRTHMLSSVSHDLRTPLTRMRLQLEMMAQNVETLELKDDVVDMSNLVEEYLQFARGDDKEKSHVVKIEEFLQEKVVKYYAKISRHIEYSSSVSTEFRVSIKRMALKRALVNLIDNAFNHGSKVALSVSLSKSNLIIAIDDDGPGIPPSERDNVTKPFYRIDNSRNLDKKAASGGSGLGLAIATDAVTSQGGRIKLSDSPFGGLRVLIYIPV